MYIIYVHIQKLHAQYYDLEMIISNHLRVWHYCIIQDFTRNNGICIYLGQPSKKLKILADMSAKGGRGNPLSAKNVNTHIFSDLSVNRVGGGVVPMSATKLVFYKKKCRMFWYNHEKNCEHILNFDLFYVLDYLWIFWYAYRKIIYFFFSSPPKNRGLRTLRTSPKLLRFFWRLPKARNTHNFYY